MQGASAIFNLPFSFSRQFSIKNKFSLKGLMFLEIGLFSLLVVFYIFQVNEYTQASFNITSYESRIAEIARGNKNLEVDFSQAHTLTNLEELLKMMNYQEVDKISYVRVSGNQVVANSR
jgi:hypothetical protein